MRGMKKWLPFKSLKGQYEKIEAMKTERNRQEKPLLSEDAIQDLNEKLSQLRRGEKTTVTFYVHSQLLTKEAIFERIEVEQSRIYFMGFTIPLSSLIALEV